MYVVAGVSGNSGAAAAAALVAAGERVRGLSRDPARVTIAGVEPVAAALDYADALTRAFEGADGAYLLCPPDLMHPDPIGLYEAVATAGADAARRTGLPRIVLLSSTGAQLASGTGPVLGLHHAERILADAAPSVALLRPDSFMENWRGLLGAARAGVLPTFYQDLDTPFATVSTTDIGRTAAALLREATPPRVVELSGPREESVRTVAAAFARTLGQPVTPQPLPRAAWPEALAQAGFGPAYAALLEEMYDSINRGAMNQEGVADRRRGTVTIDEAVAGWA